MMQIMKRMTRTMNKNPNFKGKEIIVYTYIIIIIIIWN